MPDSIHNLDKKRKGRSLTRKPWGGRFVGQTDARVEAFTQSISFDNRLFKQDIQASIAHAQMLERVGLISSDECRQLVEGLSQIGKDIEAGTFAWKPELEDIHMNIEAALTEKLGDVGRKLHTARSRNDQVATDLKLWVREALRHVDDRLTALQTEFVSAVMRYPDLILPGYTHLQRAQPVLAAHVFLAYIEKLERDRSRVGDCLHGSMFSLSALPLWRERACRSIGTLLRTSSALTPSRPTALMPRATATLWWNRCLCSP